MAWIRSNKDKTKINISFLVLGRAKTEEEEEEEKRKEERRKGKRRSQVRNYEI